MRKALMDAYSDKDFETIIKNSSSYKNCIENLGYNSISGNSLEMLKRKINKLNIDTSHFIKRKATKRTRENVFVENGDCCGGTVRDWFLKEPIEYKCSICGQEPFWNGKEMTLIMDHINGNNKDHRLENLRWVCPNCNQQLETTNGKNRKAREYKVNTCVDCGKRISKGSIRCRDCFFKKMHLEKTQMKKNKIKEKPIRIIQSKKKKHTKQKLELQISYQELKEQIRTNSFLQIGKKYNVSDNAVRKWCISYGLPYKFDDIKSYTDKEWENLKDKFYIYKFYSESLNEHYFFCTTIPNIQNNLTKNIFFVIDKVSFKNNKIKEHLIQNKSVFDIMFCEQVDAHMDAMIKINQFKKELNINDEIIDKSETRIVELYAQLGTIKNVCAKIGMSEKTIRQILRKHKIEIKTSQEHSRNANGKPVLMKSTNNEILNTFQTTNDAARYIFNEGKTTSLNACCNSIADVCKGRQQTAYGYKWEYATPEKEDTSNA